MSNSAIKKQIGGMPTGQYRLAGQEFTVTHRRPETPLPVIDFEGFELFAKAPFQELEEALDRIIRAGILP